MRELPRDPGPHRPFGSALARRGEPLRYITERPFRLQMLGPCKVCGEKRFVCEHDLEDGETP